MITVTTKTQNPKKLVSDIVKKVEPESKVMDLNESYENKGKFIFSNVIQNNGVHNIPLQRWAGKYKLNPIEVQYTNCSYQRKNSGDTEEVIITNF